MPIDNLLYEKLEGQIYHPGKSSSLRLGKNKIANFGELHPILLKTMDVNFKVFGFEIYLENISQFQEINLPLKVVLLIILIKWLKEILPFYFQKMLRLLR